MHRQTINLFRALVLLPIATYCYGQRDSLDMIHYTPPNNWKKDARGGVVVYTDLDTIKGRFCVIALYSSKKSTGDDARDFEKEWKDLAVATYQVDESPKTEKQSLPEGWQAIVGAAPAKIEGIDSYVLLTVFSGFGRTASILVSLNDETYLATIDTLLSNITLDKMASLPARTDPIDKKDQGSILGTWCTTSVSIGDYVSSSGTFLRSADVSTMEEYSFKADFTYLYRFFGLTHGVRYYTETTGTFQVSGNKITLTPMSRKGGYGSSIRDEKNLLGKSEIFEFYIGPNKWEPGPFLNLHKDGNYYMWDDFPYDYYKRIN